MARIRRITRRPLRQVRVVPAPRRRTGDHQPTVGLTKVSTNAPLYIYEPLSKDFDQMRLLKLQPRSSSPHVEIEITHVPSSAPPAYEALSYVWGSPERTHNVTVKTFSDFFYELAARTSPVEKQQELLQRVQPRHLPVPRNLFVALEHLRLPDEPRLLWIDAICINQDDVPERSERSEQVKKMGSIYSNARRVVLWLGEEADGSTSAFTSLRSLGEGLDAEISDNFPTFTVHPGGLADVLKSKLADSAIMVNILPGWQPIKKLLERQWFTRLWVVQEVLLAADAIFVVGSAILPLPLFRATIFWIYYVSLYTAPFEQTPGIELIGRAYSIFACQVGDGLEKMAAAMREKHCVDPRDKIYAILSLLSSSFSTRIIPDYLRPTEDIFKEIVLRHFDWNKKLSLLCFCRFNDPKSNLRLPSWVLDFSGSSPFRQASIFCSASGLSKQESIYDSSVDSLQIFGRQICTIDKLFEAVPFNARFAEALAICQSWETAGSSVIQQSGLALDEDAFFATIFSQPISEHSLHNVVVDARELEILYRTACEQSSSRPFNSESASPAAECVNKLASVLQGHRFFMARSGVMGLCPAWAAEGDTIVVTIGCETPLVLRPTGDGCYYVGGECFVHGMMSGEGLLGALKPGSRHDWNFVHGYLKSVFVDNNGTATQLDPRAGPLPPGWSVVYDSESGEIGPAIVDGELQRQVFHNSDTGDEVWWDPRLTSENLKKRGVDIQEFVLV